MIQWLSSCYEFLSGGEYKTIEDLQSSNVLRGWHSLKQRAKTKARILVVDDEAFDPLEPLRRNGFEIVPMHDIDTFSALEPYPIIMFDLKGIGTKMNAEMQGAHLIRETKKLFPDKYVIAYTGGAGDSNVQRAIVDADKYISKDKSISDWVDLLDVAVDHVTNPVIVWKTFRARLLEQGITPFQITVLEDCYVRNYKLGPDKLEAKMLSSIEKIKLKKHLQDVSKSLVSIAVKSLIFPS